MGIRRRCDRRRRELRRSATAPWRRFGGRGLAWMARLGQQVGVLAQPVAGTFDLHDHGVVEQPVEQRSGYDGIAEHLEMPQRLTGESLRSGSLTRIIPCMAGCFPVSERRSGRGPALIVIRLPDGRERAISRSATAVSSASENLAATGESSGTHFGAHAFAFGESRPRCARLQECGSRRQRRTRPRSDACRTGRRRRSAATPVAAASGRDATPAGAAGGTARATSAAAVRPIRGGSSC